jgi:hypothetical protein
MNHKELIEQGWVHAGDIGVDSGQAMICDPCYFVGDYEGWEPQATYEKICEANINPEGYPTFGPIPYKMGHEGAAVKCSSGYGDGYYPVYVRIEDKGDWGKRVVAMMVDFDPDCEEGEDDE